MTPTATTATETASPLSTLRTGDVHLWSRTLIPTTREAPADATTPSHVFLVRAGFIRQLAAGVYDYLPLAWRSLRKIQEIVRQEHERIGAMEMLFPAFEPMSLLRQTGRDEAYGDDLFRLTDRHGRELALAPTHEEPIVELMKGAITSYKQLPLSLYQIQTKFRDEPRPRSGLLRCREFIMKDAYSFHLKQEGVGGLDEVYEKFYECYSRIFTRCGLSFTAVEAESGPIGGSASHEFMVHAQSGEDKILVCPVSGYAANVEKAEIGQRAWTFEGVAAQALKKHHTPSMPGIEGVAQHLGVTASGMLKTIVFERVRSDGKTSDASKTKYVLAVVRGDHDVNEAKVRNAVGSGVRLADEKAAREAGLAIGYVSPSAFAKLTGATIVVDPDAAQPIPWATGADEVDHHVTGWYWGRDLGYEVEKVKVADIRNAEEGDPSPRAEGAKLQTQRGIEVGHIFKLGTKYSDAMEFKVLAEDQKPRTVTMGCYGIGISRTMAACVEMSCDEGGIVWPAAVAPYHVLIVLMKHDDERQRSLAMDLASKLGQAGADVLIDDRNERPGPKFKDADLIGIPVRLTLGDKALDAGGVEFKLRRDPGKGEVVPMADVVARVVGALEGA
ncbi:MAG: proline--tRNA ligase [Phycisphaeraceae bacterium]|nr:proline--tRNA ligase [Phycisphaeraceae bacterium]